VTIFSRKMKVVDYADVFTRKSLNVDTRKTFGMIKPDSYKNMGAII